jgi:ABC-type branched-subunit amino acid transport system ATPase component/ABC-type branched-subunit amino acid transport system permease subunit
MHRSVLAKKAVARFSWGKSKGTVLKALLVLILLAWPLLYPSGYAMKIMTTAGLYAIVTIAVIIVFGQAGQLSFAHSAFYGMGAYVAAVLTTKASFPTLAALVGAALVPGIIAFVVGRPVLKLRYFYLALASIGLGQIFLVLVEQLRGVTGGQTGLAPVPNLSVLGFSFATSVHRYYLVWMVAVIILLFTARALKYRVGRAFRAIATSEIASSTLGLRTANWKLLAFVTSAIICGIAGGLFAFVNMAVTPSSFTFTAAVLPMVMMLVGGGSVWGGIVGAILMSWVINGFGGLMQYSGIFYSVLMILLLMFFPAGLVLQPAQRAWLRSLFRRARPQESTGHEPARVSVEPPLPCTHAPSSEASPAHTTVAGCTLLEIESLSVRFGGLRAVDRVSLRVQEGQIAALIGPNGAGKTTLFNAISRLQKPTEGTVRFADKDVTETSAAATARLGMGRTFQNLRIYVNMTVLENVLVGCHRHESSGIWAGGLGLPRQRREEAISRERAMRALAAVGLEESASFPAASLPYGLQRLVEIARALASEPRLLLLDEPAAGMNAAERAHLVQQIRNIRDSGITVLLVEHDIELVMGLCEYVYVLDYGKVIADGRPETVWNDPAVIEAYLGVKRVEREDLCQTRDLTADTCEKPEELLAIEGLFTSYGSIQALRGVSFSVSQGEVLAVLGANGAGKSTLLHTISGLLRPKAGSVAYQSIDITRLAPEAIVARGLCQVPEGRQLFGELSVQDNLLVGTSGRSDWRKTLADDIAYVYELFPLLGERRKQRAQSLSGGEQQMLAIGRALVGHPTLLLLDEPSMGLAPLVLDRIYEALAELNKQGLTMLMVEQNTEMALSLAHRAVILQTGAIAVSGLANDLRSDERVRASYLGSIRS